jgi:hypothetical protein
MNACIKSARGKYIAIWNIDDLRTPESLALQLKLLESDPFAVAASGNFTIVTEFGSKQGQVIDNSKLSKVEHTSGMTLGPFFMFRKEVIHKVGMFDEQLKSGADFDFVLRILSTGLPIFTNEGLGYYLNEGRGASTRPGSRQKLEANFIYLRYGIWNKLDISYLARIARLDHLNIYNDGVPIPVHTVFHQYHETIAQRDSELFEIFTRTNRSFKTFIINVARSLTRSNNEAR